MKRTFCWQALTGGLSPKCSKTFHCQMIFEREIRDLIDFRKDWPVNSCQISNPLKILNIKKVVESTTNQIYFSHSTKYSPVPALVIKSTSLNQLQQEVVDITKYICSVLQNCISIKSCLFQDLLHQKELLREQIGHVNMTLMSDSK